MDIVKTNISHNLNISKYFPKENVCFIDIETTGLDRNKSIIYLIGILYFNSDDNTWILNQYFANSFHEEKKILTGFLSDIISFDKIITYNGDNFDLPFIKHRLKHYKIDSPFDNIKSFDLYQLIKRNRLFLDLPNLKLKTIERELGFIREDKYSGLDCISFYFDFTKSNDPVLKENILRHNYDDLAHMLDIISIIDLIDNKKSFNLNIGGINSKLSLEKIQVYGDIINIEGKIDPPLVNNLSYYDKNFNLVTEDKNKFLLSLEFNLGLITREEECRYINILEINGLKGLRNSKDFNLPPNIFILSIENKYCIDNIKNLVKEMIKLMIK